MPLNNTDDLELAYYRETYAGFVGGITEGRKLHYETLLVGDPTDAYFTFDGPTWQAITTPDSATLALNGTESVWTYYGVTSQDWSPTLIQHLSSHYHDNFTWKSWLVRIEGEPGTLNLLFTIDGNTVLNYPSTVPVGFVDGSAHDLRVVRDKNSGAITFYTTSEPGGEFVQLGATVSGTSGTMYPVANQPLNIGGFNSYFDFTPGFTWNGQMSRHTIADGGVTVLDWNAADYVSGTTHTGVADGRVYTYRNGLENGYSPEVAGEVAGTGAVDDLKARYLRDLGYTGTLPDMERAYLASLGYTGALADMRNQYFSPAVIPDGALSTEDGFLLTAEDGDLLTIEEV